MYVAFSCRLVGFLSFDVNVSDFDINQCNVTSAEEYGGERNQISSFSRTHKCHRETSQVELQFIETHFSLKDQELEKKLQFIHKFFVDI